MSKTALAALIAVCSAVFPASAKTLLVPGDHKTIQSAIDAATDGDIVLVDDGLYAGDGNRDISFNGKRISVTSRNGSGGCVIDCEGAGRGFHFGSGEDAHSVLDGFTIVNGMSAQNGGAILCEGGSPTITRCMIAGNRARGSGGGICVTSGGPSISNCVIAGNSANGQGGGLYARGGDASVINCTFSANSVFLEAGSFMLLNSILWDGSPLGFGRGANASVSRCNIRGGREALPPNAPVFWGQGNLDANPMFALPGDFHLQPESPCIDAGASPPGSVPTVDADGNARAADGNGDGISQVDIGAFEYSTRWPAIAAAPKAVVFRAREDGPNPYGEAISIFNAGGGVLHWQITSDCPWLRAVPSSGQAAGVPQRIALKVEKAGLGHGKYTAVLTICDDRPEKPRKAAVMVTLYVNSTFHVPRSYQTIQEAIDAAMPGDVVLVDDGVYKGPGNRDIDFLGKAITLRSKNGPRKCIIDCEAQGRGIYFRQGEGPDSILEGITITGGYVPSSWPQLSLGGGIVCQGASPTIRRNIITGNRGSGIYCRGASSPRIRNNMITRNIADWGGCGIFCEAGSAAEIVNNTIAANPGGGVRAWGSSATVSNCIIWGNGEDVGGAPATFCCIQDATKGMGNRSSYPHFANSARGDYRLRNYSPCIDAGNDHFALPEDLDIDGYPRCALMRVDIGAHESPDRSRDGENNGMGDDMPDDWEKELFGSAAADKWDDPDNDRSPNGAEFIAGTNPRLDQRIVYVSAANINDRRADGTRLHPFPFLQQGVEAATEKVLVAAGCYIERVTVNNKPLAIIGGYDHAFTRYDPARHITILDADGLYRAITFVGCEGAELRGFVITGGNAYHGGGVCATISSLEISRNIFVGNTAKCGGAIECGWNSSVRIFENVITENSAVYFGGGIYVWSGAVAFISNNTITGNAAGSGGALACSGRSSTTVAACELTANTLDGYCPEILLEGGSSLTVTGSTVSGGSLGTWADRDCKLFWADTNVDLEGP